MLARIMRVRIVKTLAGILDGRGLSALIPDVVYEMDDHLGRQLIDLQGAVEDTSDTPAVPLDTIAACRRERTEIDLPTNLDLLELFFAAIVTLLNNFHIAEADAVLCLA